MSPSIEPSINETPRQSRVIHVLDGIWEVAEGKTDSMPSSFDHSVPVPGLVTMAQPEFIEPAPPVQDRDAFAQKDRRRDAFWYRRTFQLDGPVPDVAQLKVHKAMFGTAVFLNGKPLGEHLPCFTPGYFDAKEALIEGENELVIRIGADRDALSPAIPAGFDFEKVRYIPGIFDSVELILSGTPNILTVQAAPDIEAQTVRVQTVIFNKGADVAASLRFAVREAKSGKLVAATERDLGVVPSGVQQTVDVSIPMPDCRLWSPEDPFLYQLVVETNDDRFETRFGMREFHFDPITKRAVLNGKTYFMRGSNITLYRFFEDSMCKDLPWREEWVRNLHRSFKNFHWNCLRYCIGFPPEMWYRIADEEGFLIQDEFPIWHGGKAWPNFNWPPELTHKELTREYTEWMQERWNHPCVVIWDAQNETEIGETGIAARQVRSLDLSNRPWDNGFAERVGPGDTFESHAYHFFDPKFKLKDLAISPGVPEGNPTPNDQNHPIIVNEYGWLWLDRDGTPTTLTKELYQYLLGPDSTVEQRRHLYARYLAAETEFWRCHRKCAAVMHFTALGYSRPDGQTSDHFLDAENLVYEEEFLKYMPDSFAPVGLMIDYWNEEAPAGLQLRIPVVAINDLHDAWKGPVAFRVFRDENAAVNAVQPCRIEALGTTTLFFEVRLPDAEGLYTFEAMLSGADGKPVRSIREVKILKELSQTTKGSTNY